MKKGQAHSSTSSFFKNIKIIDKRHIVYKKILLQVVFKTAPYIYYHVHFNRLSYDMKLL